MENKKVLYFAGGGVHFFWSAGAAKFIRENCCLDDVHIIGTSAGALTAILMLSNSSFEMSAELAHAKLLENNVYENKFGLMGLWGSIVESWLDELVSDDVSMTVYNNFHVVVSPSCLWRESKLLSNFESKKDAINACLTSIHLPWFMNGSLSREYKGNNYMDGCVKLWFGGKIPLPITTESLTQENVWTVDYKEDQQFVESVSNSHRIIDLEQAISMINAGYNFMRNKHNLESIPWSLK